MNLKILMTACHINLHVEINDSHISILAKNILFCAFRANFHANRSGHYNEVGTSPYQTIVPACATIEE